MVSTAGLMRPSEKRRRGLDDDDDEEGLERLTKASKKMDGGPAVQKAQSPNSNPSPSPSLTGLGRRTPSAQVSQPETTTTTTTTEMPFSLTGAVPSRPVLLRTKTGEEPPKQRFKLKIGGATVAAPSPAPSSQSEAGAKDGDTG